MYSSMISRMVKDVSVSKNFSKNEYNWMIMKYNMSLYFLKYKYKNFMFFKYMKSFHVNSSMSSMNSICLISGSAHWVLRSFSISRMTFHQLADFGHMNGVSSSSW